MFSLSVEDFEEKYEEQDKLGEGGFGTVFFGKRREDNFPVWLLMCALYNSSSSSCSLFLKHIFSVMQVVIKHVAQFLVSYLPVVRNVCLFLLFSPNVYLKQPNV